MTMHFRWAPAQVNRRNKQPAYWYCYVGVLEDCVAFVERHPKKWSGFVWLPDADGIKKPRYGDFEEMKRAVEEVVERWFALATMDPPATDEKVT